MNSKSKELVPVSVEQYPSLIEGSDLREAIEANTQGRFEESDLIRVPTPTGGGTRWEVSTVRGLEYTDEIVGLLVFFARRGVLWPTVEPSGEGQMPLLLSHDLVAARRVGDFYGDIDPDELEQYNDGNGNYNWEALPWNQWGSGRNDVGKRCRESRMLMILREGEGFPLVVNAQPGSLKKIRPFIQALPVAHYRAVVGLSLKEEMNRSGNRYSQIVPRLVNVLDKEAGAQVKALYTDPLKKLTTSTTVMASDYGSEND